MKTNFTMLIASVVFLFASQGNAQEKTVIEPYSFTHSLNSTIPLINLPAHDFTQDIIDAEAFEKAGNYPIIAKHFEVNVTTQNAGTWTNMENGDRIWQLHLKSQGAISTGIFYDNFYLPEGSVLSVYSPDRSQVFNYTYEDNQGNYLFSTEFINGDEQIIEYYEPATVRGKGALHITDLSHQFRSIAAQACEVNVVCTPEGTGWQDRKKGICRIYVVTSSGAGYCSGTLINNTALDCKRYILTAYHCGGGATVSQFNQWIFRFNFEATQCKGQADNFGTNNNEFTGCTKRAAANISGGSDMLLLEMTSTSTPSWWASTAYYNGWNKANTAGTGWINIHHPAGSNKKISAVNGTPTTVTWSGAASGAHWQVTWKATTNGHGITEGGSSGSPIFNSSYQVVGTLTGGSSYCTATSSPDQFGKFSYHWASNGTTAATQLKTWLDPTNSGVTSLSGSYSPCSAGGTVGINDNDVFNNFNIYPNPNNGEFTLQVTLDKQDDLQIRVFNIVGQEVFNKSIINTLGGTYAVDLTSQSAGIYFVELRTNEKVNSRKINLIK